MILDEEDYKYNIPPGGMTSNIMKSQQEAMDKIKSRFPSLSKPQSD